MTDLDDLAPVDLLRAMPELAVVCDFCAAFGAPLGLSKFSREVLEALLLTPGDLPDAVAELHYRLLREVPGGSPGAALVRKHAAGWERMLREAFRARGAADEFATQEDNPLAGGEPYGELTIRQRVLVLHLLVHWKLDAKGLRAHVNEQIKAGSAAALRTATGCLGADDDGTEYYVDPHSEAVYCSVGARRARAPALPQGARLKLLSTAHPHVLLRVLPAGSPGAAAAMAAEAKSCLQRKEHPSARVRGYSATPPYAAHQRLALVSRDADAPVGDAEEEPAEPPPLPEMAPRFREMPLPVAVAPRHACVAEMRERARALAEAAPAAVLLRRLDELLQTASPDTTTMKTLTAPLKAEFGDAAVAAVKPEIRERVTAWVSSSSSPILRRLDELLQTASPDTTTMKTLTAPLKAEFGDAAVAAVKPEIKGRVTAWVSGSSGSSGSSASASKKRGSDKDKDKDPAAKRRRAAVADWAALRRENRARGVPPAPAAPEFRTAAVGAAEMEALAHGLAARPRASPMHLDLVVEMHAAVEDARKAARAAQRRASRADSVLAMSFAPRMGTRRSSRSAVNYTDVDEWDPLPAQEEAEESEPEPEPEAEADAEEMEVDDESDASVHSDDSD